MLIGKYYKNCFLLLIPIFIWNIVLVVYLPKSYNSDIFWKNIPVFVSYSENILRLLIFSIPILMTFSLESKKQKIGLFMYSLGSIIYYLSWILVIAYPDSDWSQNIIGFSAPAFTPIIWLIGIGLIGDKTFFKFPHITTVYIILSALFVIAHTTHVCLVFQNL